MGYPVVSDKPMVFQWIPHFNETSMVAKIKKPSDSDEDYDGISDNQHHNFNH
jgi:hypothetical protein